MDCPSLASGSTTSASWCYAVEVYLEGVHAIGGTLELSSAVDEIVTVEALHGSLFCKDFFA